MMKNIIEKAENMVGKIDPRYDISCDQVIEVVNHYKGRLECGTMFFRLGYMQGQKAAKAEQKRKEAATCRE